MNTIITVLVVYIFLGLCKLSKHNDSLDEASIKMLQELERDQEILKSYNLNPSDVPDSWANIEEEKQRIKKGVMMAKLIVVFAWPIYD